MVNYRKAKAGEVRCAECEYSVRPFYEGARFRCGLGYGRGFAVGKVNTCDRAIRHNWIQHVACWAIYPADKGGLLHVAGGCKLKDEALSYLEKLEEGVVFHDAREARDRLRALVEDVDGLNCS